MFNLLRADLWRFFNTSRLRGQFWSYLAGIVALALLMFGLISFTSSDAYASLANTMDSEAVAEDLGVPAFLSSVTSMLADTFISGGLFALLCSLCAAECALSDLKAGYLKNIVSSTRGKLAYFAEKLVFCSVTSAVLLLTLTASCLLCALAFQIPPAEEPVARILGWLALTWLNGCAFAFLATAAVWIVRNPAMAYIWAIILSTGVLRELLMGLAYSSGGVLRVLQPVAPVLKGISSWMPSAGMQLLGNGGAVLDMPMAVDGVSIFEHVNAAGTVHPCCASVQVLIISVAWMAIATALGLTVAQKMDVA